jgi:hypothetical protein
MSTEFDKAVSFVFDETYQMWKSDLKKIFRIGTRGTKGGCNLSSCILVLIGIESFSKFFSKKRTDAGKFSEFFDKYYPAQYRGKMENIYELFRHGLAHNYYPKCEFKQRNTSKIAFGIDERKRVFSLSRIRKDLDNYRKRTLQLNPRAGYPYVVVPQVLFLDTVDVMERLRRKIRSDAALQSDFMSAYKYIRTILRHT